MIENQRGMSSPAGATGTIPASGRSAARADPQRDAAAERVAGDDDRAAAVAGEVLDGGRGERVVVLEHEAVGGQRVGLGEPGQVDRERAAALAASRSSVSRHVSAESANPWMSSTGGPAPSSSSARVS